MQVHSCDDSSIWTQKNTDSILQVHSCDDSSIWTQKNTDSILQVHSCDDSSIWTQKNTDSILQVHSCDDSSIWTQKNTDSIFKTFTAFHCNLIGIFLPKVRLELATPGLQTQCSSHWAIQLKSYCWEGVEFIQLVYCIIIYLSFLNCDWLLIREVQWFYWTQRLLVPVEKFAVRMPKVRLELATPGLQTQCSSHWAIQLKSYCWEGVEFIQLVYCIIIMMQYTNWINSTPSQQ